MLQKYHLKILNLDFFLNFTNKTFFFKVVSLTLGRAIYIYNYLNKEFQATILSYL